MVITKTPFRMSFFGGGTDMKEFYGKYGGSILSTTFDKYCYVTVRNLPRFFKYANELVYSRIERVNDIEEIEHPLIRNCMKYMNLVNIPQQVYRLSEKAVPPFRGKCTAYPPRCTAYSLGYDVKII